MNENEIQKWEYTCTAKTKKVQVLCWKVTKQNTEMNFSNKFKKNLPKFSNENEVLNT